MKDKRRWGPPGWPWELELLALVFVITAIAVPYYLHYMQAPEPQELSLLAQAQAEARPQTATWEDLEGFFWAIIIVGLYLAHLAMGSSSIDFMSTPFTHLFAPLVFSIITYYRLHTLTKGSTLATAIVSGSPVEIFIWVSGVLVITYLVARIRMARLMLNFRDIDWEFTTPGLFDRSYAELTLQIRPLIYPPRVYRVCEKGIVIEGWFYAMPIPFDSITAIDAVQGGAFISSGYCLATSLRSLVRIQLAERPEPILISPKDRTTFLQFCQPRVAARKRPSTRPGETRSGDTRSGGARPPRDTKSGDTKTGARPPRVSLPGETEPGAARPADEAPGGTPKA